MKERVHAELIKRWADGCEIQYRKPGTDRWVDAPEPAWVADYEYRIKPAEPARQYPVTGMTDKELRDAYGYNDYEKPMVELANAALRHACDNGQIVTREEFDRAIGDRKARDFAVAEAVRSSCDAALRALREGEWIFKATKELNLAAIIAEVK